MKKYQQLLIVSLGLVSFVCFLIYKHEYDRLRTVLEVLEVFGTPPPGAFNSPVLAAEPSRNGHGVHPPDNINNDEDFHAGEIVGKFNRGDKGNANNDVRNNALSGEVMDAPNAQLRNVDVLHGGGPKPSKHVAGGGPNSIFKDVKSKS